MNTSATITKIIPAFLTCQKKIEAVKKEADNPFFHSKYADINSLIDACKSILNSNDIVILQPIVKDYVETILIHTSGEWLSSKTRIICKETNNPQAQGSAITYARRYGLQSMLFMSAEDDDGEKATSHSKQETIVEPVNSLEVFCEVCNTKMVEKSGVKDGKEWTGYFCPKGTKEGPHPPRWV